jgi:hypothetical protein
MHRKMCIGIGIVIENYKPERLIQKRQAAQKGGI